MVKEEDYYEPLKYEFLEKKLHCFSTEIKGGLKEYGIVDVIGVRDVGGRRLSEIEMITIEVKSQNRMEPFLKCLGQAKGYSIYSHLPYLAIDREFSPKEKYIADRFGVGLIEIGNGGKSFTEVVSADKHNPINALFYEVLMRSLLVYQCVMCGIYYKVKDRSSTYKITNALNKKREFDYCIFKKDLSPDKKNNRDILFNEKDDLYCSICPDCLYIIGHDISKIEKNSFKTI